MADVIERLRGLVEKASKTPWWYGETDDSYAMGMDTICHSGEGGGEPDDEGDLKRCVAAMCVQTEATFACGNQENNSRLIVAAVNALPALLAVAEAAKKYAASGGECDREDLRAALAKLDAAGGSNEPT